MKLKDLLHIVIEINAHIRWGNLGSCDCNLPVKMNYYDVKDHSLEHFQEAFELLKKLPKSIGIGADPADYQYRMKPIVRFELDEEGLVVLSFDIDIVDIEVELKP